MSNSKLRIKRNGKVVMMPTKLALALAKMNRLEIVDDRDKNINPVKRKKAVNKPVKAEAVNSVEDLENSELEENQNIDLDSEEEEDAKTSVSLDLANEGTSEDEKEGVTDQVKEDEGQKVENSTKRRGRPKKKKESESTQGYKNRMMKSE